MNKDNGTFGRNNLLTLVDAWRGVELSESPYCLPADRGLLDELTAQRKAVNYTNEQYYQDDLVLGSDTRLHLGLIPEPFSGNLLSAKIFLLLLNPGLGPGDYHAQSTSEAWRSLLARNLRQDDPSLGFPFLKQEFAWASSYWLVKLASVIGELHGRLGSRSAALKLLERSIATLEVVPYHSPSFGVPWKVTQKLESVRLALAAGEELSRRAASGEVLVVVARGAGYWEINEGPGKIVYRGGETRAAHLTKDSRGGAAILEFLLRAVPGDEARGTISS